MTARRLAKGGVLAITALGVVSSATPHSLTAIGLPPESVTASRNAIDVSAALAQHVSVPQRTAEQTEQEQQVALRTRLRVEVADATADEATHAALGAGGAVADLARQQDAEEAGRRRAAIDRATRDAAPGPKGLALTLIEEQGWGAPEFRCLDQLWGHESSWNPRASNASGAYGIPQAMPGSRMAAFGDDWETNPVTQMRWGLHYIEERWGTPCSAWGHSQEYGWY